MKRGIRTLYIDQLGNSLQSLGLPRDRPQASFGWLEEIVEAGSGRIEEIASAGLAGLTGEVLTKFKVFIDLNKIIYPT